MIIQEENIISHLRSQPEMALKWMYDKYYSYVCGIVYKMLMDSTLAEDIAQEVFFEIWKKREQIELNVGIKPYVRRAAVNKTLNHIRSKKIDFNSGYDGIEVSSGEHGTIKKMEADELKIVLQEQINQLPEKCRIVFALSRFENLSYQEISTKLSISKKTVENQISKALKILRASVLMLDEKI